MPSTSPGGARISPIQIKPEMRIRILADEDIEKIHQATLRVLNETGVRFPSEKALAVFAEAGADVDIEKQTVRIPPDLLMRNLARAPGQFTMGSRGSRLLDLILDGKKTYCGTAGTGNATVDLNTGKRRPSTKDDVAMMAAIADYLPSINFYWPMVAAQDCPSQAIALHELEASFTHTEKHVHIVSCIDPQTARYAVEMAAIVAGNPKRMKTRPPVSLIASPLSPLSHDQGVLEAALVFAEAGLPVGFAAMPVIGSTAPASVAGALAQGNAEILSAACLIQIAYPGAPVFYPLFSAMLNPFTGGIVVSTQIRSLFYASVVQLGHYYNLPVMSSFGGSDLQKIGGWQIGKEDAIDAFFSCATGPDMLPCLGLAEGYTLLYPQKLLLDDEIVQSVQLMAAGIQIDAETLAVDEIMAVGAGGHFLTRDYTVKNIRKIWKPGISHQWSPETTDFRDPHKVAVEKAHWILKNHIPCQMDPKKILALDKVIRAAEKELLD